MVGFFIYGPQALIGIAAANQATKSAAATANGVTGIFGYLSTFVSGLGIGAMVDWVNKVNPGQGWNYVFLMMIAMAIVGMLISRLCGAQRQQATTRSRRKFLPLSYNKRVSIGHPFILRNNYCFVASSFACASATRLFAASSSFCILCFSAAVLTEGFESRFCSS